MALIIGFIGLALILWGTALLSIPAALIVAGLVLLVFARAYLEVSRVA